MFSKLMYVALEANAFHNPEIMASERYKGNKFVALDIKEVENEYMIVFIDNFGNFDVKPINKTKFLGFIRNEDVDKMTISDTLDIEVDLSVPTDVKGSPVVTVKTRGKRAAN